MADYLEVWAGPTPDSVPLDTARVTLGRASTNHLTMADPKASRLHAILERVGSAWCVRDLSSRNGTFVNGERISSEQPLTNGDEIRIGDTRLVFRSTSVDPGLQTIADVDVCVPELTRRERDVLEALCRPLLSHESLPEPATTKEIAAALVVTQAAVRQHLLRLYDKFAIYDTTNRRRSQLAREALRRGVIRPHQ